MLEAEAKWFGTRLGAIDAPEVFPMLNIGSHTEQFRTTSQPWIDRFIFAPARARGVVKHTDIRFAHGVDIVGDLTEPAFVQDLRGMNFKSVFFSNVLEHIEKREELAGTVTAIVPSGGYLFVSVPYRFPYHPDPIDTMFRPTPEELATLFPGTRTHAAEIVASGTLVNYLAGRVSASPSTLLKDLRSKHAISGGAPAPSAPGAMSSLSRFAPWLAKTFKVTCIVLRKE
jgi:hypothetical protein